MENHYRFSIVLLYIDSLNNMVKWYWKCNSCGSIVIHFNNGTKKSVTEQYIKDNNIDLTNSVSLGNSYHCENCFSMEKFCEDIMK